MSNASDFIIENGVLTKYVGREKEVTIPDGVTAIGEEAFSWCSRLTNIVIPESVTAIGDDAFEDCRSDLEIHVSSLEHYMRLQITDPHQLCLNNILITDIALPDSVTAIGDHAFHGCSSLTSIVIPGSVKTIEKDIFSDCKALRDVQISPDALAGCKSLPIWECAISCIPPHDLIAAIKKCPKTLKSKAEKRILESDSKEAMVYFEKQSRLEEYAAFHNTDADTLRDSILSNFGLDENGCRTWPMAGSFVTARMEKNLSITLLDANGKVLKSVPKKGADPAEFDTAKKELAQLKKDIASAAKLRNNRLLADFLEARPRSAESWKATYLKNPLLKALAKLVVWQQGDTTFILDADGTPIDAAGKEITLGDGEILLAHPMEMGAELTRTWQAYFLSRHLSQPFAQVWEPVLDGSVITPDRYAGATIPQYMLMNKELHGITMEGQSKLKLRDCTANLKLIQGHHDWVNNEYEITNFRFKKFTRAVNHIAAHFDKGTVQGRLLKDDASAAQWLDYFTLAQITDFVARVTEKGDCPNSAAALLEYKQAKYPDTDPFADFVLEW